MPKLVLPKNLTAGTTASASDVMANFNAIKAVVNALDVDNFSAAGLLNDVTHGNLSAYTSPMHCGTSIIIDDPNNYWTIDTAQGMADQIGPLVGVTSTGMHLVNKSYHATDPTLCTVNVPINSCPHGIVVIFGFTGSGYQGSGNNFGGRYSLKVDSTDLSTAGSHPEFDVFVLAGDCSLTLKTQTTCNHSTSDTPVAWDNSAARDIKFGTYDTMSAYTGLTSKADFYMIVFGY